MTKSILFSISSFLLLFSLGSCEGNTDYEWKINNNSSADINVVTSHFYGTDSINETVPPGTSLTILLNSQFGGNSTPQDPANVFNDLEVKNLAGDTLTKDYKMNCNWVILVDQRSRIPSNYKHEYVMLITDSDF